MYSTIGSSFILQRITEWLSGLNLAAASESYFSAFFGLFLLEESDGIYSI
jgi:hypothetical protein